MSILFECEYDGQRYAGLGIPAPGDTHILHRVTDEQLRAAVTAGDGPQALLASVTEAAETVQVKYGDPGLRFLPPLLPTATNNALVNGFAGTHLSKFRQNPSPEEFTPPYYYIKGFGSWLRMPGEALTTPASPIWVFEEAEVALVYVNDDDGLPHYARYTFANDLHDIGLHQQNPWAATPYAKLCETSVAPWLFLAEPPQTVTGQVTIEREGVPAWQGAFACGRDALHHRVEDLADHVLSYPLLRQPGLVNYLLLGADKGSYHDGFRIEDGDRVVIDVTSHGVVLPNTVRYGRAGTRP